MADFEDGTGDIFLAWSCINPHYENQLEKAVSNDVTKVFFQGVGRFNL